MAAALPFLAPRFGGCSPQGAGSRHYSCLRRKLIMKLHWRSIIVSLSLLALVAADANAQDYPDKPVRIITHSAPGGSPDALLRLVGDRLSQMWGRQVVVLNHPGAGGAIAARTAAQAAPDGYTLYMPASSAF